MSEPSVRDLPDHMPSMPLQRIVFERGTSGCGPTVLICVALHGNESDGYDAALAVARALEHKEIHGRVCIFIGNLAAYQAQQRYITRDLNRSFTEEEVATNLSAETARDSEAAEQRAILELLSQRVPRDGTRAVFLDLHCTSAAGPPFAVFGDTLANRRLGFAFRVPAILGLEEAIDGTLIEFLARRGHVAVCVEGGQLKTEATRLILEAAIWVTLVEAGALTSASVLDYEAHRVRLERAARSLPRVLEIRHREALQGRKAFAMRAGFQGFDRVERQQHLADDEAGAIRAKESGYLLMPLYQAQGDDGFFLARAVRRFWLRISTLLRWLRLDRGIAWLPGVQRDPTNAEALLVDPKIARWWTIQVFHLCGYRRQRAQAPYLSFSRRRPDHLSSLPVP